MNNLLEISRRSLLAYQSAMNTAGQNVANAGTPGYARRRLILSADGVSSRGWKMRAPHGAMAAGGVSVQTYERVRDGLLTAAAWEAETALGTAGEQQRILGALEGVFPPGDGSLHDLLNDFWDGWSDLANDPTGDGARHALRSRAQGLAATLGRMDADVANLQTETTKALTSGVEEVNGLLKEVAALNEQIARARHSGSPDLAAEDRRDQAVEALAGFGPVRVHDGEDGYRLTLDGMTLVQGADAFGLELDDSGPTPRVLFAETGIEYAPEGSDGGKLGAWRTALDETLPQTRSALDELAQSLVTEVNALHRTGYGLDGAGGRDFFDPAGTTAASLRLSADILADPAAIAATGDPAAMGSNSLALDLAGLRDQKLLNGGTATLEDFAVGLVSGIGADLKRTTTEAAGHAAVRDHLTAMAQGVSGVSIEEEMTNLIQYQQGFAAAARVLDTAQQMMDTLLTL